MAARAIRRRLSSALLVLAALALNACSTYDLPQASEANLRMPGGSTVAVTDLRCLGDGVVVGAGLEMAGVSTQGGVLMRSVDGGLNWTVSRPDPSLSAVTPWFLDDPRDAGKPSRPLYVTGHANAGIVRAMVDWTPSIGTWLKSGDQGATWTKTAPLAPFGTTTSTGADPQPLVAIDAAGSLATVRVTGRLNVFGDSSVLLVRSRDGGRTWTETTLPELNSAIWLFSDGRGGLVVVGLAHSDSRAVAIRSDDGGDTWTRTLRTDGRAMGWNVRGTMDSALFVWTPSNQPSRSYSRSVDGGRTWSSRDIALWRPFSRLVSLGERRWAALSIELAARDAQEAVAWVSADDGATWSARTTGIRRGRNYEAMAWASTLAYLGDGVLIAHAGGSRVARSADGGASWQLIDAALPERDFGIDAHCTDGDGTVILGNSLGLLTRSTDRGLTWQAGQIAGSRP